MSNDPSPNAPVFNWIDITNIGIPIGGLGDDNSVGPIDMKIDFHYYWSDYTDIYIGSNGYIGFQPLNISSTGIGFPNIPTVDANNNFVAPFLADLSFAGAGNPGQVYTYSNFIDTFIVSYVDAPFWINNAAGYGGANSFQVIFSSVDSSITFQYLNQTGSWDPVYNAFQNPIMIGIENVTGNIGLEITNNTLPNPNFAIKFFYPPTVLINVPDVEPTQVKNDRNGGFFTSVNGAAVVGSAEVSNVGNVDVTTPTTATLEITDGLGTVLHTDMGNVDTLLLGATETIDFTTGYTPTAPGSYSYTVETTNSSDINISNDVRTVEMIAVDTTLPTMALTYWNGTAAVIGGTVGWSGGDADDGLGIYIEPPFYPIEIESVDLFLFSTGTIFGPTAAEVKVFDDDGPAGQGTLLDSAALASIDFIAGDWNTITFNNPITITSGGFYVGYYMTGEAISIGVETNPPFANRGYEILGNTWSDFRFNDIEDPFMEVNVRAVCNSPIPIDIGGPTDSICTNEVLVLDATNNFSSFQWNTGETTSSINVTTPGLYSVTVRDSNNCVASAETDVSVLLAPLLDLGADISICQGSSAVIDANPGFFDTVLWSDSSANGTLVVSTAGIYSATLTTFNGCSDTDSVTVTVSNSPTVALGADTLLCDNGAGTGITLDAGNPGASYQWSTGDTTQTITTNANDTQYYVSVSFPTGCAGTDTIMVDASISPDVDLGQDSTYCDEYLLNAGNIGSAYDWSTGDTTQFLTVTASGSYSVTVTNADGCTDTDDIDLVIGITPDVMLGNDTSSCEAIMLDAGNAGASYLWSTNETTQTITASQTGTYSVEVATAEGCMDSDEIDITILEGPMADFSFTTDTSSVMFTDNSSNTTTWAWDFGDGNMSTDQNPSHTYEMSGTYPVMLIVSNECGNDTFSTEVTITITSIEDDLFAQQISLYPNPNQGTFQLFGSFPEASRFELAIFDLRGQRVFSHKIASPTQTLDQTISLEGVSKGIYFVQISNGTRTAYKKLIVE